MAATKRVLGQSYPNAGTLIDLYTVDDDTQTVCSTITACNRGDSKADIRVSVAIDGAADDDEQYIIDTDVLGKRTHAATIGITLAAGDVVRVWSSSGKVAFNLFGQESPA